MTKNYIEQAMIDGYQPQYNYPASYLTAAANKKFAWSVTRTQAPFSNKDDLRVWHGPTLKTAIRRATKDINEMIAFRKAKADNEYFG